ncbi:MAG: hypothetical protein ACRC6M_11130 [Microcystaceae cyanobacterium]
MTGKVLDGNPKGLLVVILPLAFGIVLVYKAWRIILLLLTLVIGFIAWDTYQWQQKCQQIDPLFNQLIKVNQGRVTQTDLAIQGIAKGRAAQRYLDDKAAEYGAYQRQVQDVTVYYFITATTLGTIFDDSEPEVTPQLSQGIAAPVQFEEKLPVEQVAESVVVEIAPVMETAPVVETPLGVEQAPIQEISPVTATNEEPKTIANSFAGLAEIKEERKHWPEPEVETAIASAPKLILIQSDLAKRLDTTSSTIARRKNEAEFTEWAQSKDPDGLAWNYDDASKLFTTV